ncbi:hypothetical protein V8C86DRAFT_2789382 [Haematococcus lacustris]
MQCQWPGYGAVAAEAATATAAAVPGAPPSNAAEHQAQPQPATVLLSPLPPLPSHQQNERQQQHQRQVSQPSQTDRARQRPPLVPASHQAAQHMQHAQHLLHVQQLQTMGYLSAAESASFTQSHAWPAHHTSRSTSPHCPPAITSGGMSGTGRMSQGAALVARVTAAVLQGEPAAPRPVARPQSAGWVEDRGHLVPSARPGSATMFPTLAPAGSVPSALSVGRGGWRSGGVNALHSPYTSPQRSRGGG